MQQSHMTPHPLVSVDVTAAPQLGDVVRADNSALRDQAFSLRYQAYRRVDAIPENAAQRFSDAYDLKPNSMTYMLTDGDGEAIGAIRASLYRPEGAYGLPCFEPYRAEIAARIGFDKRIVESSRFVTADVSFDVMLDSQYRLFRMIWANALVHDVDWVITSMRRKHLAIYRRLFEFVPLSEPKPYPGVTVEGILCGLPRQAILKAGQSDPRLRIDLAEARCYAL